MENDECYYDHCPYCGARVNIDHDDGYGMEEGEIFNDVCPKCGKTFVYSTFIIINHDISKADCLNDEGEHQWEPTKVYPRAMTKMKCKICGEERDLTSEERKKNNIPTMEEYRKELKKEQEALQNETMQNEETNNK